MTTKRDQTMISGHDDSDGSSPEDQARITPEDLLIMNSSDALEFAKASIAASHNALIDRRKSVTQLQAQADLWLNLLDQLRTRELQSAWERENERRPNLGLASTLELLEELEVRFHVSTPDEGLLALVRRMTSRLGQESLQFTRETGSSGSAPDPVV